MTLPHPPKRTSSDTTHVSDSEVSSESSTSTPSAPHPPFSVLSNITNEPPLRWTVERRLANIERGLVDMAKKLESQRPGIRKRGHSSVPPDSSPTTPITKRARVMRDQSVGGNSPVGSLAEPLIHRSSLMATTPEREELNNLWDETFKEQFITPGRRPTRR